MQAVTSKLLNEQKQPDQKYYRKVELLRLYWNGAAFVWDTALDITAYVKYISLARWMMDVRAFNQWQSPSFRIDLNNKRNYWSEIEPKGFWLSGVNAPYYPQLTKIRVIVGQTFDDGTTEEKYSFGGVVTKPPSFKDDDRTATLECSSQDEILRRSNAEDYSILVTGELMGSDSGTVFTTDNDGVGLIRFVRKGSTVGGYANATNLIAETNYSISDTNEKALPITVTLKIALVAGESLWITYRYWYSNIDIADLVIALLGVAGITNYQVDPVIFNADTAYSILLTSQAHWEAGTLDGNIDTTTEAGSFALKNDFPQVFDDFSDRDYTNNPTWTVQSGANWTAVNRCLENTSTDHSGQVITTPNSQVYGTWQFKIEFIDSTYPVVKTGTVEIYLLSSTTNPGNTNGYMVEIVKYLEYEGVPYTTIRAVLYKVVNGVKTGGSSTLYQGNTTSSYNLGLIIRIIRQTDGKFECLAWKLPSGPPSSPTSTNSLVDNTITATSYYVVYSASYEDVRISSIRESDIIPAAGTYPHGNYRPSGQLKTAVQDTDDSITALGLLEIDGDTPAGTTAIHKTETSVSDAPFTDPDGPVEIGPTGQQLSTPREFWRGTVDLAASTDLVYSPKIRSMKINYSISLTLIELANLIGMSVYDAIMELAKMCNYEFGFDAGNKFFFRQRNTGISHVLTIDHKTNLKQEIAFNTGADRVANIIEVQFGDYRKIVDSDSQGEAHPNSIDRYGKLPFSISGSNLLPKESELIAVALAQGIYNYTSVPRKRAKIALKYFLQYELGDPVKYFREHRFGRWKWGDRDRRLGDESDNDFVWHDDPNANGWNINMRIEGMELDTENWQIIYDLVEIL